MKLGASSHRLLAAAYVICGVSGTAGTADAIPLWAHEYGVTCQKCHSEVPHLTAFGAHFAAAGYRIPGVSPGPAFPVSVKVNLVASSANQGAGPGGAGLPKTIVDEVELLTGGSVGSRGSYFVEQYAVDGGMPGMLREGWLSYRASPERTRAPIVLQAGSMTLPVPVDPETFRETYQHYTIFDQTVGSNPFNFFDPKFGAKLSAGDALHGTNVELFAGPGHDRQSGLPATGTDLMTYAQQIVGPVTLSAYNYQGTRPATGSLFDRFERTGFGAVVLAGKWEYDSVLQTGFDSNVSGAGTASSGGFGQLRYAFDPRFFALVRYEGTNSEVSGMSRDGVVLLGYRPDHASRITLEDVLSHSPGVQSAVNLQYTVAH